jgi:hypothetical protein
MLDGLRWPILGSYATASQAIESRLTMATATRYFIYLLHLVSLSFEDARLARKGIAKRETCHLYRDQERGGGGSGRRKKGDIAAPARSIAGCGKGLASGAASAARATIV